VPFNNLRGNSKDIEKRELAVAGKPGSACVKKFLSLNTELSDKPICTASITFLKRNSPYYASNTSNTRGNIARPSKPPRKGLPTARASR
jgi:hypothetical protein